MSDFFAGAGGGLLGAASQFLTNRRNEGLMRESWAREDTAVQRRVADLKAAGLSPTLAAGSAAESSGPISVGDVGGAGIEAAVNAMRAKADVRKTQAETEVARQTARKVGKEADFIEGTFEDRVEQERQGALLSGRRSMKGAAEAQSAAYRAAFNAWYHGYENTLPGPDEKPVKMPGMPRQSPAAREALARMSRTEAEAVFRSVYTRIVRTTGALPSSRSGVDVRLGKHNFSASMSANVQAMISEQVRKFLGNLPEVF